MIRLCVVSKLVAVVVAVLLTGGCVQSPRPTPKQANNEAAQTVLSGAALDTRFRSAVAQWREEVRWGELIGVISFNKQLWDEKKLRHIDDEHLRKIYHALPDVILTSSLPGLTAWRAKQSAGEAADEAKREFVLRWREIGPDIHAKRVMVVEFMMKEVLGYDMVGLGMLDYAFPEDEFPWGGQTAPK